MAEKVKDSVGPFVKDLSDKAGPFIKDMSDKAKPHVEAAQAQASKVFAELQAGPYTLPFFSVAQLEPLEHVPSKVE